MHISVYVYIHIYVHKHVYVYICIYAFIIYMYKHICVWTDIYIYAYIYIYIRQYMKLMVRLFFWKCATSTHTKHYRLDWNGNFDRNLLGPNSNSTPFKIKHLKRNKNKDSFHPSSLRSANSRLFFAQFLVRCHILKLPSSSSPSSPS